MSQVDALRQLGVGAAYLNSTLPESQVVSELNRIKAARSNWSTCRRKGLCGRKRCISSTTVSLRSWL